MRALLRLCAHCVAVRVTSGGPPVAATSVHQSSNMVISSVPEDSSGLVHVNFPLSVVVRVREMPMATLLVAVAIVVVRVIAHREQTLVPACLEDVASCHCA